MAGGTGGFLAVLGHLAWYKYLPAIEDFVTGSAEAGKWALPLGISYYTLPAMVEGSGAENSAYAVVRIEPDLTLHVTGRRKAKSAGRS